MSAGGGISPATEEAVRAGLASAAEQGRRVLVVGTAVDLRDRSPDAPDVEVLWTTSMTGVTEYEPADLTLTAQAGTRLSEIADALEPHGQWLPFDPPRVSDRTVGGLVASAASGPLWCGYGAPRDHTLGCTLVTGDGRVLQLGGRVMKNVAGFDLLKLVVGSRGSLGVVTSVTLRVFPRPAAELVLEAIGPAGDLALAAPHVAMAPVLPASAVLWREAGSTDGRLVIRLHGAAEGVHAEARLIRNHLKDRALGLTLETVEAERAPEVVAGACDAAFSGTVVRFSGLPALLPRAWARVSETFPAATLVADVMSGRMRAATDEPVDADTLRTARAEAEAADTTLILARASADLFREVGVHGRRDDLGLSRALRQQFDPTGVLVGGGEA